MKTTATLSSSGRCSFVQTWRIFETRPTQGIMSCTGATSWRRWASWTWAQRTSHSGEQPAKEGGGGGEDGTSVCPGWRENLPHMKDHLIMIYYHAFYAAWITGRLLALGGLQVLIWLRELSRRKNTGWNLRISVPAEMETKGKNSLFDFNFVFIWKKMKVYYY